MASKLNFQGGRIILGTAFVGWKIRIFEAGSTTPKTSYKDSALTVGNENTDPIVLDTYGAAQVWFSGNAKAILYTPLDVVVYTDDNINLESSTDSSGEYNSILNPSFETDSDGDGLPDSWDRTLYSTGAYALDTTTQAHGATAVKFTSIGAGGGYVTSANSMAVSPLSTRLLSWSMKSSAADVRNVVEVYWYKTDGTASATASTTVFDDATTNPIIWTRKKYAVTVPSDAYYAKVRLIGCHTSDATTGSTWYDDVEFRDEVLTTRGDVMVMGSNGPTRLAKGTAGQALVMNAAGTDHTWWAPRQHIAGLTYSNNVSDATNDIDVAVGECADSANAAILTLTSAITKRLDAAWAVGTNQGGLDTGSIGNSDYYLWLIARSDTGVVDVLMSLSATAPTMPTSYDLKRLFGWFKRVGGAIVTMTTYETAGGGIELVWTSPTVDISLANTLTTSRRTDAVKVPLNFSVIAHLNIAGTDAAANWEAWVYCPDQGDSAPSPTTAPLGNIFFPGAVATHIVGDIRVRTSAAGLIASRSTLATVDSYLVATMGFTWSRRT